MTSALGVSCSGGELFNRLIGLATLLVDAAISHSPRGPIAETEEDHC
jgi:hypothetical protein